MTIPFVPDTSTEETQSAPSIVMLFVMVTAPNPPGSRTEISPPAAVFEIAPANVLQGAVPLQGFASSPTPETHVRDACAFAGRLIPASNTNIPRTRRVLMLPSVAICFVRPIGKCARNDTLTLREMEIGCFRSFVVT